jgi:hypothetical protein
MKTAVIISGSAASPKGFKKSENIGIVNKKSNFAHIPDSRRDRFLLLISKNVLIFPDRVRKGSIPFDKKYEDRRLGSKEPVINGIFGMTNKTIQRSFLKPVFD